MQSVCGCIGKEQIHLLTNNGNDFSYNSFLIMIEKDYDEDSKFYRKSQRAGEGGSPV